MGSDERMQNEIQYFKFDVFGEKWGEIAEKGRLIFQNKDNIVKPYNVLSDLVFLHLANGDLSKLEDYFLKQGFLGFPVEAVNSNLPVVSIGISRTPNLSVTRFSREEVLELINSSFETEKKFGRHL